MQSLEDGVRSTVNSIYEKLSDTGTWGSGAVRKARTNQKGQQGQEQVSELTNSARMSAGEKIGHRTPRERCFAAE